MNWTAISAVADLLAAIAVVASLIYVAIQIRHNTRQNRLSAQQTLVGELGSALQGQAQSRELASLLHKGMQNLESLDAVEKIQFLSHVSHILRLYESVYFHRLEGTLDERVWKGFEGAIADIVSYPGMRAVVAMRRRHLSESFGNYLGALVDRHAAAPVFGEPRALSP